jgi:UDP-GlcNAc:undecaprenyl-phosphate/decaprenyl-phosphate GlcNAc-1-phosphate transferase
VRRGLLACQLGVWGDAPGWMLTVDPQLIDHLWVAGVSFVVVVATTPIVKRLAPVLGAMKVPGDRHVHEQPTPELGGLAMLAGVFGAIFVATRLDSFGELFRTTSEPETIVLAALVITYVGVVDDTRTLGPGAKLAGQVLAASTLVLFGLTINFVYIPFGIGGIISLSPDAAALLTILAVVAMINAVNLVDGLDGLAAGIVAIGALALFAYIQLPAAEELAVTQAVSSASLILAAVIGACLGFLVYNSNPASIFMGDTGAMLLGLLLAASGVSAIGNTVEPTSTDFFAASVPVLIPALVLAVPFLDTALAVVRRLGSGRSISSPDKKHLHHRLVAIGHSQRRAVLVLYAWSALLAGLVVGPSLADPPIVLAGAGVLAAALLTYQVLDARRLRRRRRIIDASDNVRVHPGAGGR